MSLTYKNSGVNIAESDKAVDRIKEIAKQTFNKSVLGGIGSFGALFKLDLENYAEPVLVSSVDGVGTKIKIAVESGIYDSIGIDLVNHCVDDILSQGAIPLFFMDYIGTGKVSAAFFGRML